MKGERLVPSHTACEAPQHVDGCNGIGNTRDHFTPRAIGRELGWTRKEIDDPGNTQWLSPPCHTSKDRSTPFRLQQVKLQREGVVFKFGEHVTFGTKSEPTTRKLIQYLREKEIFHAPKKKTA